MIYRGGTLLLKALEGEGTRMRYKKAVDEFFING
jgi:hypothetical protein